MENCAGVAALIFGNKYSGYGYTNNSTLESTTISPLASNRNPLSKKGTPTCILLKKDKTFEAVGYEAEEKYDKYCTAGEMDDYFFFMQFQTLLHSKSIETDEVEDVNGKKLNAKTVFSAFIAALKNKLENETDKKIINFSSNELRWIITIPADLKRPAEKFMINCAEQAGINVDQLILIPEAEAALAYCQQFLQSDKYSNYQESAEYMIVGLEGGHADIRVVKIDSNLLTEKSKKTVTVDGSASEYKNVLKQCFPKLDSSEVMKVLRKHSLDYLDIERGLEEAKRIPQRSGTKQDAEVDTQDNALNHLTKNLNTTHSKQVYLKDGKILFADVNQYDDIFNPTISSVVSAIKTAFEAYEGARKIQFIVLTGDFYECCLVRHAVGIHFPLKIILFFEREDEMLIKGALLSGQQPFHFTFESLQAYDVKEGQKGLLLVINFLFKKEKKEDPKDNEYNEDKTKHKERTGSCEDVQKLRAYFEDRNYDVLCWSDSEGLTAKDLIKKLEDVAKNQLTTTNNYHCFICIIMSHGNLNKITTSEGKLAVDDLVRPFKNDFATDFIGKPKIFMIQTCRGPNIQFKQGKEHNDLDSDEAEEQYMPTDADIIKIYATTEDYKSFRGMTSTKWKGAWLIQAFLCVAKRYPKSHLLEILTAVNYELAHNPEYELTKGKCQLSISEVALTKLFYLYR